MEFELLTQERLKDLLEYNPETGIFKWRTMGKGRRWSLIAGTCHADSRGKSGYIMLIIDYKCYLAHRVAWFYTHGVWPKLEIDHINRDRGDNRITNLREASHAQNNQNTIKNGKRAGNLARVAWNEHKLEWELLIRYGGGRLYQTFRDRESAVKAYAQAANLLFDNAVLVTTDEVRVLKLEDII